MGKTIEKDIVFVTDFVCPFCIVGKEALKQALAELNSTVQVQVYPYELTEEPKEQVDTFHDEERKAHYTVLEEPARELGLNITVPPAVTPRPYTRLAFEGWHYAKDRGREEKYADLVYHAYFTDQRDIGQMEVLVDLAGQAGLDQTDFRKALLDGTYYQVQRDAVAYAKNELAVKHVPTIYVGDKEIVLRTYTKEEMIRALTDATEVPNRDASEEGVHFGCSPDGCKLPGF